MSDKERNFYIFRMVLNEMYNELSWSIKKRRKRLIRKNFRCIINYIWQNIEFINKLSFEERYMVLNCVKIARSEGLDLSDDIYESQEYKILDRAYKEFKSH